MGWRRRTMHRRILSAPCFTHTPGLHSSCCHLKKQETVSQEVNHISSDHSASLWWNQALSWVSWVLEPLCVYHTMVPPLLS